MSLSPEWDALPNIIPFDPTEFKLYALYNGCKLFITYFHKDVTPSLLGSYEEKLSIANNNQMTLEFSIVESYYQDKTLTQNPIAAALIPGRTILLEYQNHVYYFTIVSIQPTVTANNSTIAIKCNDNFSYLLSNKNVEFNFDTNDYGGPMDIYNMSTKILQLNSISGSNWVIDPNLKNSKIPMFPDIRFITQPLKASLTLSNSNPYNALVSIAELFNAIILPVWEDKNNNNKNTIYFINRASNLYKGITINGHYNGVNLSTTYSTENFCTSMSILGGEDANNNLVSALPDMPAALKTIMNNDGTILGHNNVKWTDSSLTNVVKNYLPADTSDEQRAACLNFADIVDNKLIGADNKLVNFDYLIKVNILTGSTFKDMQLQYLKLRNVNLSILLTSSVYYDASSSIYSSLNMLKSYIIEFQSLTSQIYNYLEKGSSVTEQDIVDVKNNISALNSVIASKIKGVNCLSNNFYDLWKQNEGNSSINQYIDDLQKSYDRDIESMNQYNTELSQIQSSEKIADTTRATCLRGSISKLEQTRISKTISFGSDTVVLANLSADAKLLLVNDEGDFISLGYYAAQEKCISVFDTHQTTVATENSLKYLLFTTYQGIKNNILSTLYNNYSSYIYERSYQDTDQITSEGLLSSAYSEFVKYNTPTHSCGITMLDYSLFSDVNQSVSIGEQIKIYDTQESGTLYQISSINKDLRNKSYQLSIEDNNSYEKLYKNIILNSYPQQPSPKQTSDATDMFKKIFKGGF